MESTLGSIQSLTEQSVKLRVAAARWLQRQRPGCPCCEADHQSCVPIRYGVVHPLVRLQAYLGEVVLGGVNFGSNEPRWACVACGAKFGAPNPNLDRFGRASRVTDSGCVEVLEPARLATLASLRAPASMTDLSAERQAA